MVVSKINDKYKVLYTSDQRYYLVTGGRGSGKSHTVNEFLLRLTFERGHGILFTRYTMTSAETSIIPEFTAAIERLGMETSFIITKKKITNIHTGSFIIFSGIKASSGSNTANLKSLSGITTFVVEEAEDLASEEEFEKINKSVRTKGKKNRVILIMNPQSSAGSWIYDRWFKDSHYYTMIDDCPVMVSNHKKLEHIHTTYLDAREWLDEEWLEDAEDLKRRDVDKYANVMLGGWKQKSEGTIINDWEIGEFDHSLPHIFGLDFGTRDKDAMARVAVNEKTRTVYIKQEMFKSEQTTEQLIKAVKKAVDRGFVIADSAGARHIQDLASKGIRIKPVKKGAGSVLEGIKIMQSYTWVIDPSSAAVITAVNNYKWKSGTDREVPDHAYSDIIDAIRYAMITLTKKRRSVWA